MKIKDGFMLREVAGNYIVVATGSAAKNFKGIINLNETGAFLWKIAEQQVDKEKMLSALLEEYEVDEALARKDIDAFVDKLVQAGLI